MTVEERITHVVESVSEFVDVDPHDHFTTDMGMDSLDLIHLQVELEKEFVIRIPDDDAQELTSIAAIVKYFAENEIG